MQNIASNVLKSASDLTVKAANRVMTANPVCMAIGAGAATTAFAVGAGINYVARLPQVRKFNEAAAGKVRDGATYVWNKMPNFGTKTSTESDQTTDAPAGAKATETAAERAAKFKKMADNFSRNVKKGTATQSDAGELLSTLYEMESSLKDGLDEFEAQMKPEPESVH